MRPGCLENLFRHRGGRVTGVRLVGVHAAPHVLVTSVECDFGSLYASRAFGACGFGFKFCVGSEVSSQCQDFRFSYVRKGGRSCGDTFFDVGATCVSILGEGVPMGCIAIGFSIAISDRLWYLFFPRTFFRPGGEVVFVSWEAVALIATSAYVSCGIASSACM